MAETKIFGKTDFESNLIFDRDGDSNLTLPLDELFFMPTVRFGNLSIGEMSPAVGDELPCFFCTLKKACFWWAMPNELDWD